MAIENLNIKLESLTNHKKSEWEEKAKKRLANKSWLKHSRKIAIKINSHLKSKNIKQKNLADLLNVSPQQVSKIIKGRENLTLETISKIESVLNIQLLELNKTPKTELKLNKGLDYKKSNFKTSEYKYSTGKVIKVDFKQKNSVNNSRFYNE